LTDFNFGDCWYADLNPVLGREQGMKRSVIVISNEAFNKINGDNRLVVSISSSNKYGLSPQWIENPWILKVPQNDFGTMGYVLANQVRTIDMSIRKIKKWGTFSTEDLEDVLEAVHFSIPRVSD